jgi:hypothetical protein
MLPSHSGPTHSGVFHSPGHFANPDTQYIAHSMAEYNKQMFDAIQKLNMK